MKLLFYVHSLTGAGAERVTVNLANDWAARGQAVTIVTSAPQNEDAFALHPSIVRICLGMSGAGRGLLDGVWRTARRALALRRVLGEQRPDLAIGVMCIANVILALASRGHVGVRTIGTEHIFPGSDPLDPFRSAMRRLTYGRLDAVVALTRECADWLEANTPARGVRVIPNAVSWPVPAAAPRVDPAQTSGRRRAVAVGRFAPQKGFDRLLTAFGDVAGRHPDWDLAILGEGPDRGVLEARIREAGLAGRVQLPGWVGNVGEWYERADLFVLSSRYEGFPCALVEAMACGLPAVAFDCDTGPRDIVRDGVDGLLVPPDDVAGLAAALDRLMADASLRETYGARACDARERFAPARIRASWERLFAELAGPDGRPAADPREVTR